MMVEIELETYDNGPDRPKVIVSTDGAHSQFVSLQIGDGPTVLVIASELAEAARRASTR